jgi:hypothetical protein
MASSSAGTVMLGSPLGQQFGVAHHEHMLQRRLRAHLLHHRQQHVGGDDHARLQVAELVLQLVFLVQRPAGADDGADLLDAVVRHEVLRAVVHEQRHGLALLARPGPAGARRRRRWRRPARPR